MGHLLVARLQRRGKVWSRCLTINGGDDTLPSFSRHGMHKTDVRSQQPVCPSLSFLLPFWLVCLQAFHVVYRSSQCDGAWYLDASLSSHLAHPSTLRITCLPRIGAAHHTVVLCSSSGLGRARINLRLSKFGACRRRSAVSQCSCAYITKVC